MCVVVGNVCVEVSTEVTTIDIIILSIISVLLLAVLTAIAIYFYKQK